MYYLPWARLTTAERKRRIKIALDRLAAGETLKQVGKTWNLYPPDLCRLLIHHAPVAWRNALAARALARYEQAINERELAPTNIVLRARVAVTRWHLSYALDKLAKTELRLRGQELCGQCPDCKQESAYAPIGTTKPARCYKCDWTGDAKAYCLSRLSTGKDGQIWANSPKE